MKRFRGGLVFKAHRLVYHSTLGLRVIKKKNILPTFSPALAEMVLSMGRGMYMGTSLIRNRAALGPYSRTILRALWWS